MRLTCDTSRSVSSAAAARRLRARIGRALGRMSFGLLLSMAGGVAQAHEWYTDLRAPDGTVCCNGNDCAPVDVCYIAGLEGVLVAGKCQPVPEKRVVRQSSPDGREHACYWGGEVRCVIRGAGT